MEYFARVNGGPISPMRFDYDMKPTKKQPKLISAMKDLTVELAIDWRIKPKQQKDGRAFYLGYARPSGIKRTRKRLRRRAALMDHTSYEWSQWWPKSKKDKR